jgi:hypothetical protein
MQACTHLSKATCSGGVVKRLLGSDSEEERRSGSGFAAAHAEIQRIRESLVAGRKAGSVSVRHIFSASDLRHQARMIIFR